MKEPRSIKIKVAPDEAGERLDLYLTFKLQDLSRSYIKNQINDGVVRINGETQFKPQYRVKKGDVIEASLEGKNPSNTIRPENIPLDIIFEDEHLLAVNKPVGLVTHPATGNWSGTLMNGVVFHFNELRHVGDPIRSGLIHRLDKETSGIILIGKTNRGLWYYSRLFAERKVEKTYRAVVRGDISGKTKGGSIEVRNYLGRNPKQRKKIAEVDPKKGRLAISAIRFISALTYDGTDYSLVEIKPTTGRTHQIRVHLASLGFPVLGDTVYGRSKFKRLMLHAWKLNLKLLNGEQKELIAPLPRVFTNLEAKL
ncbi:MAG: RluA family pseudouridine synthase [Candidatus Dojkabacteria bacterium]